jgi:uncharacterized protein
MSSRVKREISSRMPTSKKILQEDIKEALKARDALTAGTLRLLLSGIKNKEIEKKEELTEEEILKAIQGEAKKRKEAIEIYTKAGRTELAEKEAAELKILQKYLPEELGDEELQKIVDEAIAEVNPATPQDFGKVMGAAMKKTQGRADPKKVTELVKKALRDKV